MPKYIVYVAVGGENKLLLYDMALSSGGLELRTELALPDAPGPLAVVPNQRYLYVGLRPSKTVMSYQIDPNDGTLTHFGPTVALEADPCYLATDQTGRWLLAASYSGGRAFVHPIDSDGSVDPQVACSVRTQQYAHCIETDVTNRFAFLPHVATANVIHQYQFDAATGQLLPNAPERVEQSTGVGPRHYVYHPTKDILYFSNEQGGSVTAYHLDPAQGTLTAFQSLSTLPANFQGNNTCAQIHIDPKARFLYVSNRGHDSIACFAIDAETGALTALGQQPTEPIPRAFNLDPTGQYLYVSGQGSGQMTVYQIDQETGLLTTAARYPVGERPMWVMVLALGE